eukprot:1192302-Prorocentrum_minimum.AAC.2
MESAGLVPVRLSQKLGVGWLRKTRPLCPTPPDVRTQVISEHNQCLCCVRQRRHVMENKAEQLGICLVWEGRHGCETIRVPYETERFVSTSSSTIPAGVRCTCILLARASSAAEALPATSASNMAWSSLAISSSVFAIVFLPHANRKDDEVRIMMRTHGDTSPNRVDKSNVEKKERPLDFNMLRVNSNPSNATLNCIDSRGPLQERAQRQHKLPRGRWALTS